MNMVLMSGMGWKAGSDMAVASEVAKSGWLEKVASARNPKVNHLDSGR